MMERISHRSRQTEGAAINPYLLQGIADTLVVQDLAQANHIAFGGRRWRVVTWSNNHVGASDP